MSWWAALMIMAHNYVFIIEQRYTATSKEFISFGNISIAWPSAPAWLSDIIFYLELCICVGKAANIGLSFFLHFFGNRKVTYHIGFIWPVSLKYHTEQVWETEFSRISGHYCFKWISPIRLKGKLSQFPHHFHGDRVVPRNSGAFRLCCKDLFSIKYNSFMNG